MENTLKVYHRRNGSVNCGAFPRWNALQQCANERARVVHVDVGESQNRTAEFRKQVAQGLPTVQKHLFKFKTSIIYCLWRAHIQPEHWKIHSKLKNQQVHFVFFLKERSKMHDNGAC